MRRSRPVARPSFPVDWGVDAAELLADTPTSHIWEVTLRDGTSAIVKDLKPAGIEDELPGILFLQWRNGEGAVQVLGVDGHRVLMEHAGEQSLKDHLQTYGDEAASVIAAETICHLHRDGGRPAPKDQQPLRTRFKSLFDRAYVERGTSGQSLFAEAARLAEHLLADQRNACPLHGDIHHDNLLLGRRGWLAIDAKGVLGDPAYETANLFCNPDSRPDLYEDPARAISLARLLASALDRDEKRLLQYGFVHGCLSAAWYMEDGDLEEAENSLAAARAVRQAIG